MKNKKLKILAFVLMIGGIVNTQAANVTIGSFATGQYLVNGDYTNPAPSQSASGLSFTSAIAIGDTLSGDFASPLNWSSYGWTGTGSSLSNSTLGLLMTMTQSTNPNLNFTVTVFGTGYDVIQRYSGSTAGMVKDVQTFVALTPNLGSNLGGSPTQVIALDIGWDGAASTGFGTIQALQSSFEVAAIPEPSVASLLALGTVGLVALRVRRKS
jgi:hypothetical protein